MSVIIFGPGPENTAFRTTLWKYYFKNVRPAESRLAQIKRLGNKPNHRNNASFPIRVRHASSANETRQRAFGNKRFY